MTKPRVLIADPLSTRAIEIFQERGVDADVNTSLRPDELKNIIKNYDAIAVRSATRITKDIIDSAGRLKLIGRAGMGVDNIDLNAATTHGVVVMNTPYGNALATAEHTIAMMLALARQIPQANASTHAGKWERNKFTGTEVTHKVLGLIGCGTVGALVAERAIGLKMRVIAHDPFLSDERARELGVEPVDFATVLRKADFLSIHTPLNDKTRNLLDDKALFQTKRGVYVINCARSELVVVEDLKAAIEAGHVAGAAIDAFSDEVAINNPLFGMEQVICTPRLSSVTAEAQDNVATQIAEQVCDYLLKGVVTNALNMPSLSTEDAAKLKPYLKLVNQLGNMIGQIADPDVKSISIQYEGHAANLNVRPLTAVVLKTILGRSMASVNMINALEIAAERHIDVRETLRHHVVTNYQTLIRVVVETKTKSYPIEGTLFDNDRDRIVSIENVELEATIAPIMLYLRNNDRPGFIGNIGKTLADADVNIASFDLGRNKEGGETICLIAVDQPIKPGILKKIQDLPNVLQVQLLNF
jgi:D-3-phosphoglycerate dehydrogenase